jgi:hypothetical protein
MNPLAVALIYCKLSSNVTYHLSWATSQLFESKYEDLSNFYYRDKTNSFSNVPFYFSESYIHA